MRHTFLALCSCFAAIASSPAEAGIIMQGKLNGVPITFEMGLDRSRVLGKVGDIEHLVDLGKGHVYQKAEAGTKRWRAAEMDDGSSTLPYKLADWSEGPPVAGHGSRYNVLELGETICGEVLASRWMGEFMTQILDAVELVQRVDERLKPEPRDNACGSVPFRAYNANGWPLLAGWREETVFQVERLTFDHKAAAERFQLPASFTE